MPNEIAVINRTVIAVELHGFTVSVRGYYIASFLRNRLQSASLAVHTSRAKMAWKKWEIRGNCEV